MLRKCAMQLGASAVAAGIVVGHAAAPQSHCEKIYESGQVLGRGVKLELWKANHKNVDVLDLESETIQTGLTHIRDFNSSGAKFVHCANKLIRNVLEAALTQLPNDEDAVVTTPLGHKVKGIDYEEGVSICGIALVENKLLSEQLQSVLETTLPFESLIGHLQIQGESGNLTTIDLPAGIEEMHVILLYPEFASFEKIQPAIKHLLKVGVAADNIQVVTLVTCPAAADKFSAEFSDVSLVTAAFDTTSDSQQRIVPGIGNFEKRYLGEATDAPPAQDEAAGTDSESSSWTSWWPFK
ncbi:unnamed protein product [Aphanomyces euteiches]|uniref:Phosphoribosyltransferase domain-containing protein n=1 Tax=Aphanomyces euteiches TaxID=100861 RepID=A0A6G0WIT7_9STRA|nr:hypothetical protein Ae201684_014775 [Aphanomyces euteiches]KAH9078906.1 hypothetical protein Ae201684P_019969 [Aphanomyces euteiches]